MKKNQTLPLLALSVALLSSCNKSDNEITAYDIPKEESKAYVPKVLPEGVAVSTQSVMDPTWMAPSDWVEEAPGQMRDARWTIKGTNNHQAEVTIASFPGDVGGELANLNRWRSQVGLPPVTQEELEKEKQVLQLNDSMNAVYFNIENADSSKSTVAAIVKVEDKSYFFKMMGDSDTVEEKEQEFLKFMLNVKFK